MAKSLFVGKPEKAKPPRFARFKSVQTVTVRLHCAAAVLKRQLGAEYTKRLRFSPKAIQTETVRRDWR
jgi:hypothetical protein